MVLYYDSLQYHSFFRFGGKMLKKLTVLVLVLSATLAAVHIEAAKLSCNDIYGNWSGAFSNYKRVNLTLKRNNPVENGHIRYEADYGSMEFGGFKGKCHVNADGSLTMNLSENFYGINGTINTHMISPDQLQVQFSISYGFGMDTGAGVLHKS